MLKNKKSIIKKMASVVVLANILMVSSSLPINAKDNNVSNALLGQIDYNDQMSTKEKEVMNVISEGLKKREENIDVSSFSLGEKEINKIVKDTYIRHPEFFYVDNRIFGMGLSKDTVAVVCPQYLYDEKETATYQEKINKKTKEILNKIDNTMNDFQKALIIHDEIVLNCKYENAEINQQYSTIYGGLIDNSCDCNGYAKTYSYLLSLAGIDSEIIYCQPMYHMWNKVKIDNNYYNVDVTWDDPMPDSYGLVGHDYFLFSDTVAKKYRHHDYSSNYSSQNNKYDNSKIHKLNSKVCYVNNKCFAINNSFDNGEKRGLFVFDENNNISLIKEISSYWKSSTGHWAAGFSGLGVYNEKLYFNTSNEIYEVNPINYSSKKIASNTSKDKEYYGLIIEDNNIYTMLKNDPNYNNGEKALVKTIERSYKIGDVNEDGNINIKDATEIQKWVVKIRKFTDEQKKLADVNGDGIINVVDATDLQMKIMRLK